MRGLFVSDHEPQFIELFENDTQPRVAPTFTGVDVSVYRVLRMTIFYDTFPLLVDGVVNGGDNTSFSFPVRQRVTGVLSAPGGIGDAALSVTVTGSGQNFANLPAAGEIQIGAVNMLYTAKTSTGAQTGTLTLASPLAVAELAGAAFEKLPDYRAGTWNADIQTVDSAGEQLTFHDLKLVIEGK